MWWKRSSRCGLTLVELVVVVAVIALIIAITLPAVQSSREAARRAQCLSQLKQIGAGLLNHASVHGRFPFGVRPDGFTKKGLEFALPSPLSVHYQLLPYIEQTSLFNAINVPSGSKFPRLGVHVAPVASGPANTTFRDVAVALFLCPSDSGRLKPGSNYRGTIGPNAYCHDGSAPDSLVPEGGGGMFPGLRAVSPRDLTDGASQTVGFSERIMGSGASGAFSRRNDIWFTGVALIHFPGTSDEMARVCDALTTNSPVSSALAGRRWIVGSLHETLYNHVTAPNSRVPDCGVSESLSDEGIMLSGGVAARSAHPGGVNVLMMDGGVRFIGNGVQLQVWRALASRAGGEVLGSPF